MSLNTEILEKLRKLLRLRQSSNRHEAELAMQRAFELAARHNIDIESVAIDQETKRILHKAFGIGGRISLIRKLTISILENYFNVNLIMARPNFIFVGTETDVEIGIYVHNFLVWTCSKALKDFEKQGRRKLSMTKRNSFIAGFMYGIHIKLSQAKEQLQIEESKTALVLAAKANRDNYCNSNFKLEREDIDVGRRNCDAMVAGVRAGKETEINKGLKGATTERLQLTL